MHRWYSHGRCTSIDVLQGEEIKLEIDDFSTNNTLNSAVRNYHGPIIDYAGKVEAGSFSTLKIME